MCVLQIFEYRAVKLIRAVFGDDIDDAAQRPTIFRVIVRILYFEFAGGLGSRNIRSRRRLVQAGYAVHQNFVRAGTAAVYGDAGRSGYVERPKPLGRGGYNY